MGRKVEGRLIGLAAKLEQLGPAAVARMKKAWDDPDASTGSVSERYNLQANDLVELVALWGPKAKPSPGHLAFGRMRQVAR